MPSNLLYPPPPPHLLFTHPPLFDTLYLAFDKSYDSSRNLELFEFKNQIEPIRSNLSITLKRSLKVKEKLLSAAIYPFILFVLITGLVFLLLGLIYLIGEEGKDRLHESYMRADEAMALLGDDAEGVGRQPRQKGIVASRMFNQRHASVLALSFRERKRRHVHPTFVHY